MPPARHVDELGCANDCVDGAGQFIDRASTDTEEFDVAHIGPSPSAFATLRKRRHLLGDTKWDHHADQQRNRTLDGSSVPPPTWCFSWSKQGPIRASKNFREKR
jgi:hypothetical protein